MVKLEEYKLTGYKNILEADLSFENVNVIIGSNNSGKSNFIQSISFINFIINTASTDDLEKYFSRGFYNTYFRELIPFHKTTDHEINFKLKFSNSETNRIFNYHLVLKVSFTEKHWGVKYDILNEFLNAKEINKPGQAKTIFNRENNTVKYGAELKKTSLFEEIPNHLSVIRVLKFVINSELESYLDAINSLNTIVKTPIFYFSNLELLKIEKSDRLDFHNGRTVSFDLKNEIIKLEKTTKWGIFKEALKNILGINNVTLIHFYDDLDEKNNKNTRTFLDFDHFDYSKNLDEFSDGTILIIALITKVLSSNNSVFLIEEPENSTHPKAVVDLFYFLKSFSEEKQFIITSHSIAILNKTKADNIIVSNVNKEGLSSFFNIKNKIDLKTRLKQGQINFSDELFFGDLEEDEFE